MAINGEAEKLIKICLIHKVEYKKFDFFTSVYENCPECEDILLGKKKIPSNNVTLSVTKRIWALLRGKRVYEIALDFSWYREISSQVMNKVSTGAPASEEEYWVTLGYVIERE